MDATMYQQMVAKRKTIINTFRFSAISNVGLGGLATLNITSDLPTGEIALLLTILGFAWAVLNLGPPIDKLIRQYGKLHTTANEDEPPELQ